MKTGYKYLWLLVPWVEAAMKTFAIMIDQQNSDQTASNQFESLAMSGCQKAVSETLPTSSTKFQCKWIFAPPASYTSSPTTWLISQISSDPTIIHGYMMGFYYADLLIPIASHFPNISFSFNDAAIDPTSLPNIQGIVFQEDEAGFLAGVTAGSITQTNIVAVVGNYPIPPIQRYMQGYLKGVKY
ncbi:hypothetical protein BCR33DRAFT_362139 [Rhizoclosmatium globosum]|uniref:ABC transporter substrate-binding protein PnrA-like domain-containing protein n=1 Tax=Rhizoclosmatium globosum TaxID=329046 RepID=A0A1Y2BZX9_9FUNG|nr:hypothetical protein BCR33DRAFT_362139 [Rhizoclosmatium globosum]|eukprot:ORY40342.1 hypothetical protein BCR33DRAFT_362139 [Rhizoclosmatium globosum]